MQKTNRGDDKGIFVNRGQSIVPKRGEAADHIGFRNVKPVLPRQVSESEQRKNTQYLADNSCGGRSDVGRKK